MSGRRPEEEQTDGPDPTKMFGSLDAQDKGGLAFDSDEPLRGKLDLRQASLLRMLTDQPFIDEAFRGGIIEIRASCDDNRALAPGSVVVQVNSDDAQEALASVHAIEQGCGTIIINNALQFLTEIRQFLKSVFDKVSIGDYLIIIVPHQFLFERKYRLPSRRNALHRRFYTSGTLLSDIEEAIDPAQFRIRFLAENDFGFDYLEPVDEAAEAGQDIVLAIQRLPDPNPATMIEDDERWSHPVKSAWSTRFVHLDETEKSQSAIKLVQPDRRRIADILIIKLDHRGDFLLASDAFRAMRTNFADAKITLLCGSWNQTEAEGSGFFDRVIAFNFFPEDDSARLATPSRDALLRKLKTLMADESFDLAMDLRLYEDTREVLRLIKARHTAGFDKSGAFPWLSIRLDTLSGTDDDRAEQGFLRADRFDNGVGTHRDFEIRIEGDQRFDERKTLIWGPYQKFKQGNYLFECIVEPLRELFDVMYDVVAQQGSLTLAAGVFTLQPPNANVIWLSLVRDVEDLEFRLWMAKGQEMKPLRFSGVRYVRHGGGRGVHQVEAMALLAELVKLRLREPFTTGVL